MISWIHWNLGAIKPYLPETGVKYREPKELQTVDWRASALSAWHGDREYRNWWNWTSPDNQKHRWLPVRGKNDHVLDRTPIEHTAYDPFGKGWSSWQIGAQEHYSFLENLENNELWRYQFHTWDFQYARVGIQFIAIMGKDINLAKPIAKDDEQHFAVTIPQKLGRRKSRNLKRVGSDCGRMTTANID